MVRYSAREAGIDPRVSRSGHFTSLQYEVPRSEIRKRTNINDIIEYFRQKNGHIARV